MESLAQLTPARAITTQYVKDSFSRVAMTLDVWEQECKPGETLNVPLLLHNDSPKDWSGKIMVFIYKEGKVFSKASRNASVASYSKTPMVFNGLNVPSEQGVYRFESELTYNGTPVRSRRRIYVK